MSPLSSASKSAGKQIVFLDFDNTITSFDVLDDIIERFAAGNRWRKLQKQWESGKISTINCLKGQLNDVRLSKRELFDYLSRVKIDPAFPKLLKLLKKKRIPVAVVSDNFDLIIKQVFRLHQLKNIKVYSNQMQLKKNRFILKFPHFNKNCPTCAHCKKTHLLKHPEKFIIYAGDGRSDICPSRHADLVFAKARLLSYLRENKKPYVKFKTLSSILKYYRSSKN